jgi:hypothetical protein
LELQKADFSTLNYLIRNTDWSDIKDGNIDQAYDVFTDKFFKLAKHCIPAYMALINPKDKPWLNSEIRRKSRQRDQ